MSAIKPEVTQLDSSANGNAELQKFRSELIAGAASAPGQPVDAAYFQSLRSAVAQGLSGEVVRSADQVFDRLEAKYEAQIDARRGESPA